MFQPEAMTAAPATPPASLPEPTVKRTHRPPSLASSLGRAFEVLELFSLGRPVLRVEALAQALGYTRSTAYRYVRELCDAGLLAPSSAGTYVLGPRIIELERLLRLTDPLYLAGRQVLPALHREDSVLLLQSLYGDKVLCIYSEGPQTLEHRGRRLVVRRTRGLPFPLFRGAASLALLAGMPGDRIREVYLRNAQEIAARGLGADWETFRTMLMAIRRKGWATSGGQLGPHIFGIAVPIATAGERRVIGSPARVFPREPGQAYDGAREASDAAELQAIARSISAAHALAASSTPVDPLQPTAPSRPATGKESS